MVSAVGTWAICVLCSLLPACRGYVAWIYPGREDIDLTFNYKDVVYFTWVSSIEKPWMNLRCAPSPDQPQSKNYSESHAQCFSCCAVCVTQRIAEVSIDVNAYLHMCNSIS